MHALSEIFAYLNRLRSLEIVLSGTDSPTNQTEGEEGQNTRTYTQNTSTPSFTVNPFTITPND